MNTLMILIKVVMSSSVGTLLRTVLVLISLYLGSILLRRLKRNRDIKKNPDMKENIEKAYQYEMKALKKLMIAICFILLPPLFVSLYSGFFFPTAYEPTNQEWLGFWGSYMGGVIGAIVTGVAFFFTYKQNEKQHEETKVQNEIQHKQTREQMKADKSKDVCPFLDVALFKELPQKIANNCTGDDFFYLDHESATIYIRNSDLPTENQEEYCLHIRNIGLAAAINARISIHKSGCYEDSKSLFLRSLARGDETYCYICLDESFLSANDFTFFLAYENVYGEKIVQGLKIDVDQKDPLFELFITSNKIIIETTPFYKTDPSTRQPSEVNQ